MEVLRLVRPDESLLPEIEAYKAAMLESCSSMDGCGSLRRHTPEEWLENCRNLEHEQTCPEGWVPALQFVCIREGDGRIVGMIDLRLRFNDFLAEYGGNVGYSVHPDERRKGYAKRMLAMVLGKAREQGIRRVLVTCMEENEASRRTIEANGGEFERSTYLEEEHAYLRRYWIKTT